MKVLKIFKRFPCLFGWITIGRLPISSQAPCSSHFLTLWPHHAFLSIPFASNTLTASQLTINPSAVIVIRIYFFEFPEGEARQELPPEPHQLQLLPGLRTAVRYKQKRRRRRRRRAHPTPIPRAITYIHTYYYCYYHPSTYLLRFSHIFSYYTQKQTLEGETSGGRVMPQKEEGEELSSKTRFILLVCVCHHPSLIHYATALLPRKRTRIERGFYYSMLFSFLLLMFLPLPSCHQRLRTASWSTWVSKSGLAYGI